MSFRTCHAVPSFHLHCRWKKFKLSEIKFENSILWGILFLLSSFELGLNHTSCWGHWYHFPAVRANTTSVKNPHVAVDFREFLFPNCFDKAMTALILVMVVLVLLELREQWPLECCSGVFPAVSQICFPVASRYVLHPGNYEWCA